MRIYYQLPVNIPLGNITCDKPIYLFQIDVLINNAARQQIGPIIETDMAVDKAIFDVNYFGPINLTKLVLKQFLQQGKGHIVVVSSIAGKYGKIDFPFFRVVPKYAKPYLPRLHFIC